MGVYHYALDAIMIPLDTWDMQSMRKKNPLIKELPSNDLGLYKTMVFWHFFKHLGRENQNSKMIALPYHKSR